MQIYLDESGDLGWNFSAPYGNGGSSRYLALAFLFLPLKHRRRPKNIIRELYRKYKWKDEKKASNSTLRQKELFCKKATNIITKYPDINIDIIVVNKTNVQSHIREDANKLYNYMSGLVIPDYVCEKNKVEFIPDKRSVKVESGNSLVDYLETKLWFDHNCATSIKNHPQESHKNYNLQFADWLAHCAWIHFEFSNSTPFNILSPKINTRRLFF
ncbi:MAG TPA: DUF3800 domain-containing protein [candidate division Zixibacteria bacterium]|nr:DUF3800 domain-containing protein [candidate division Zixibacteria bacterium]